MTSNISVVAIEGCAAKNEIMNRALIIPMAATLLSGCGHDVYRRADTTDTQYTRDENACFDEAEKQPYAALGGEHAYSQNIAKERKDIRACMTSRGYILQPEWPLGPYGSSPTTGPNPAATPLSTTR
jgi:hypothetical protein